MSCSSPDADGIQSTLGFHLLLPNFIFERLHIFGGSWPPGVSSRQKIAFHAAAVQQVSAPAPARRAEAALALEANLKGPSSFHKRALRRGCSKFLLDSMNLKSRLQVKLSAGLREVQLT